MIEVSIKIINNRINEMLIEGHAQADIKGKDLVCAGVSSISIGLLNALDLKNLDVDMKMNDGYVFVKVNNLEDETIQTILYTGLVQLETMENSYSKYIRIRKQEV